MGLLSDAGTYGSAAQKAESANPDNSTNSAPAASENAAAGNLSPSQRDASYGGSSFGTGRGGNSSNAVDNGYGLKIAGQSFDASGSRPSSIDTAMANPWTKAAFINKIFDASKSLDQNALTMFRALGWTASDAAAAIGNHVAESGPNVFGDVVGDKGKVAGGSHYGFQWNGDRLAALKTMFPNSYGTLGSQLAFADAELRGNSVANQAGAKAVGKFFMNNPGAPLADKVTAFYQGFEQGRSDLSRPMSADSTAHPKTRLNAAQALLAGSNGDMVATNVPALSGTPATDGSGTTPQGGGTVSGLGKIASQLFEIALGVGTRTSFGGDIISGIVNNSVKAATGADLPSIAQAQPSQITGPIMQASASSLDTILGFVSKISPTQSIQDIAGSLQSNVNALLGFGGASTKAGILASDSAASRSSNGQNFAYGGTDTYPAGSSDSAASRATDGKNFSYADSATKSNLPAIGAGGLALLLIALGGWAIVAGTRNNSSTIIKTVAAA